ncbi:hypothetical protein [Archangium sp.]|uniref:hypothetical protein n=1 Tax=Archangium sp. TaxID=1872627 RepID=UPI00389987E4
MAGLSVAGASLREPPCAYLLGQAGLATVATPAIVVLVPPEQAGEQPVRVHLDEEGQGVLGYSRRSPGEDEPSSVGRIFVAGAASLARAVTVLRDASGTGRTCEHLGVSTPAIPILVSRAVFDAPGSLVETPTLALQLGDHIWSAPGYLLPLREGTLVLPTQWLQDSASPWPTSAEPRFFVDLGGELRTAHYLAPLQAENHF